MPRAFRSSLSWVSVPCNQGTGRLPKGWNGDPRGSPHSLKSWETVSPPGHVSMGTAQPMPIRTRICPSPGLPPSGRAFPVCFPGGGTSRVATADWCPAFITGPGTFPLPLWAPVCVCRLCLWVPGEPIRLDVRCVPALVPPPVLQLYLTAHNPYIPGKVTSVGGQGQAEDRTRPAEAPGPAAWRCSLLAPPSRVPQCLPSGDILSIPWAARKTGGSVRSLTLATAAAQEARNPVQWNEAAWLGRAGSAEPRPPLRDFLYLPSSENTHGGDKAHGPPHSVSHRKKACILAKQFYCLKNKHYI